MSVEVTRVPRPSVVLSGRAERREAFAWKLRQTLSGGDALSIQIKDGETFQLARYRLSGNAAATARKVNARVRTSPSADGTAVLIWLEPKDAGK